MKIVTSWQSYRRRSQYSWPETRREAIPGDECRMELAHHYQKKEAEAALGSSASIEGREGRMASLLAAANP
jgi:hypothetical protein